MIDLFRPVPLYDEFRPVWYQADDEELVRSLHTGERIVDRWRPLRLVPGGRARRRSVPDFPGLFDDILIASPRALQTLRPLFDDAVEALPVIHPSGETFFALNVVRVLDCLLVDRCQTNRLTENPDPYFSQIYSYVFDEAVVRDQHIFRSVQMKGLEVYVSAEFKALVEQSQLVGLRFVPIFGPSRESGV